MGEKFRIEDYYDHPYFSEDAARWIVEQRFRLVGVDTMTPEMPDHLRPAGFDFPIHHILLGNGVLVLEHLFLEEVIGQRFDLFVGSLKIANADGAPARVLAMFEDRRYVGKITVKPRKVNHRRQPPETFLGEGASRTDDGG